MPDEPRAYEQTLVTINREHAASVARSHYSPWLLAIYVTLSLWAPLVAGGAGWLISGWLAMLVAGALALPVPVFVVIWAWDAGLVERERLKCERLSLSRGPLLPRPAAVPEPAGKLRPGLMQNGVIVPPKPQLTPELAHLRAVCLQLARLGAERGTWARSALAEGAGAPMRGEDWDLASRQLQDLQLFWVKPGKGGGLLPMPEKPIAETIARLEAAQ